MLALIWNNRISSPEVSKSSSDNMYFFWQCGRKKQELSFRKISLLAQKHKTANGLCLMILSTAPNFLLETAFISSTRLSWAGRVHFTFSWVLQRERSSLLHRLDSLTPLPRTEKRFPLTLDLFWDLPSLKPQQRQNLELHLFKARVRRQTSGSRGAWL